MSRINRVSKRLSHTSVGAIVFIAIMLTAATAGALKIAPLPLAELEQRATHILIGQVSTVADGKGIDGAPRDGVMTVNVDVCVVLKGETTTKTFTLQLFHTGRKSFDPKLRQGAVAVFFLSSLKNGTGELAHWGSVAVIQGGSYLYRP
jgi:hypothetical protein